MHPGIRLRCRGSLTEAAVYGFGLHRQLPRLLEHVDAFVTLSRASKTRLAQLGLPARRAAVLPNFVPTKAFASESRADSGTFALATGRLAPEKGFDMAIAAARGAGVQLVIAGTGPDEGRLRSLADNSVTFVGHLPADQLSELRSRAAVALVPSRCEEHCPYAVLEALAAGLPVLASARGGLPELVGEDATVAADDLAAWTTALQMLWRDPKLRLSRGRDALARARDRFGENRHYTGLLSVYGDQH